jgi:hypothetical protein
MTQLTIDDAEAAVREARETLAQIITKCGEHERKLADIGRLRAELSYDAHRGDPKSRKALDQLHLQAAKAESEGQSFESAISEAQHRVQLAEQSLAKAQASGNAQRALDRLRGFQRMASCFDETIATMLHAHSALLAEARAIRQLGCGNPTEIVVRNSLRRALLSALVGSHLQTELVPPPERHTASQLVERWSRGVEGWAGRFETNEQEAA